MVGRSRREGNRPRAPPAAPPADEWRLPTGLRWRDGTTTAQREAFLSKVFQRNSDAALPTTSATLVAPLRGHVQKAFSGVYP